MVRENKNNNGAHPPGVKEPLSIVIVDDNPSVRECIHDWAQDFGVQVFAYPSGDRLLNSPPQVSPESILYLIDDELPDISSIRLIQMIQLNREGGPAPLFMICEDFNANMRNVSRQSGVHGWLLKPVEKATLEALCRQVAKRVLPKIPPLRKITFGVKMGKLNLFWNGEQIFCRGVMDENSAFDRLDYIAPSGPKTLILDWQNLLAVNIEGLKEWQHYCEYGGGKDKRFIYRNCPPFLIECFRAMPDIFTHRVEIETVNFPNEEETRKELNREANFLANTKTYISLESIARNILHAGKFKEVPYDPNRHFSLWVRKRNPSASLIETYNLFLCAIHRHTVSELLLTRETVLDHSSKLLARLSCCVDAIGMLNPDIKIEVPNRTVIVARIQESYDSMLLSMVAIQQILHSTMHVCTCIERNEAISNILKPIIHKWPHRRLDHLKDAIENFSLCSKEDAYTQNPSPETKTAFIQASFAAIEIALRRAHEQIEGIGLKVFRLLEDSVRPKEIREWADQILEGASLNEEGILDFQHRGILSWSEPNSDQGVFQQAQEVLDGIEAEFQSIVLTLDSHDQIRQLLEHRLVELQLMAKNATKEKFIPLVTSHAATLLEKVVLTENFKEYGISFGTMVQTGTVNLL